MATRTFVLIIFDGTEADWLVEKAAETAVGFDAHLTALHPFNPVVFTSVMGAEPIIFSTMLEWEETTSANIRTQFDDTLRKNGLQGEYRGQTGLYGAETFLLGGTRSADVVILGATAGRSPDDRVLVHRIVRESGRPVLALGKDKGLTGPANRIVIGWTDTREATRAAHDAIGLAAPGAEITLVSLHTKASEVGPGLTGQEDLAAALDRAGFSVTIADRPATAEERAEELIRFALEVDADLLVTGAFGHSQIYDMLVGAVTRDLLEQAPLPILLSH